MMNESSFQSMAGQSLQMTEEQQIILNVSGASQNNIIPHTHTTHIIIVECSINTGRSRSTVQLLLSLSTDYCRHKEIQA